MVGGHEKLAIALHTSQDSVLRGPVRSGGGKDEHRYPDLRGLEEPATCKQPDDDSLHHADESRDWNSYGDSSHIKSRSGEEPTPALGVEGGAFEDLLAEQG